MNSQASASSRVTVTSLNPDAPSYFPSLISPPPPSTTATTAYTSNEEVLNLQELILTPPSFIPPAIHVPHEFLLPLNHPPIWQSLNHHHLTILQHQLYTTNHFLPPPPPPPMMLSAPPPRVETMPVSVDTPDQTPTVGATKVVIFTRTNNNGPRNRRLVKAVRGRKGVGFRFGRRVTGRSSEPVHEEKKSEDDGRSLGKYQSVKLRREEDKTTVMIKNIPNHFTPGMLVEFVDWFCLSENSKTRQLGNGGDEHKAISAYDFLYLPMDFKTNLNKGYAFVNFTEPEAAWNFFLAYDGQRWDFNRSPKTRKIVSARIQGKEALVAHFNKSNFDCESDEYLPFAFSPARDGSGNEVQRTVIGHRVQKSRCFARS
ncbi:OLC1v1002269C1 [Oldenlandia corymbosa var. corymbosa]|uniref:OLC1v1002269C1 n=1 Tax=Oldenlandia corymbosa var. corymbosa TaxID=529605 RepID=A0AAV1D8V9_OLDCO|nr:OLC1v1002269C1 [Oldenlandia corymbosa var. corymbosa]